MAAAEIFDKFFKFQQVAYSGVEDFSDRLNFQVTVILLLACCTTVTLKTYILSPVACYIPNEVGAHSGQEQFVNNYCWTEGTYAVPVSEFHIDNTVANPTEKYQDRRIVYYQWVPFVLGLQALMFYLPKVLWSMMSYNRAGTDVGHIIQAANEAVTADADKHAKLVQHVCRRLEQMLCHNENLDNMPAVRHSKATLLQRLQRLLHQYLRLPSHRLGYWLIFNYFVIKLFYIANALGQLWLMHSFLGFNATYFAFGFSVLENLRQGRDWTQTMVFPRVGSCAVYYRAPAGGNYVYSQCTLPINMINEKIYIFLWFWVLGTAVITILSIPTWVARLVWVKRRASFVKCYLSMCDMSGSGAIAPTGVDRRDLHRFVRDFLRYDGIFLLKMIALNSGDVVCSEIVQNLWAVYRRNRYGDAPDGLTTVVPQAPPPPGQEDELSPLPAPLAEFEKTPILLQRHVSQPAETHQRLAASDGEAGGARRSKACEAAF